jgi:hypothetical protein
LGKLPPNAPLRSDDLRAGYDVGIGPLREALSRFVAERLFDVNQITTSYESFDEYWTAQTGLANTVVEPIRKISAAAIERLKAYPFKTDALPFAILASHCGNEELPSQRAESNFRRARRAASAAAGA